MRSGYTLVIILALFLPLLPRPASAQNAPESFAPLVKAEKASVVNISTRQVIKVQQQSPFGDPQMDEFFYRFFGGQRPRGSRCARASARASSSAPTATF